MERKAFLEKKDQEIFIYIENIKSTERELMAIYNLDTREMRLLDVARYYYVLRHQESLHLILGFIEEKGWITPVGDRTPLMVEAKKVVSKPKPAASTGDDKLVLIWLTNEATARALLDSPKLIEKYGDTHLDLVPTTEDGQYIIATTNVKKKDGIESQGVLTLISPSMKQSLEAITGLDKDELNNFITANIKVAIRSEDPNQSSILDLKDTTTFYSFKRALSELRKGVK